MNHPSIRCPEAVSTVLGRLQRAGYRAYAVGGCVRDTLLGIEPHDWDVTTSARPEEVLALFSDLRTIPTGLQHGTVTVLIKKMPIEVTTFRIDGAYSDARHPESVRFSDRIADDLSRRDFTVNALAWNPENGILDCFDGIRDLESRTIRAVGKPEERFREDALRIMRAYRFAAQLGFSIAPETRRALREEAPLLAKISRERVSSEFLRLISAKGALSSLMMLREDGVIPQIFPGMTDFAPSPEGLKEIETLPPAPEDRMGFLLYHTDKPRALAVLRSLKLSNQQFSEISALSDLELHALCPESAYEIRKFAGYGGLLSERILAVSAAHGVDQTARRALLSHIRESGDCTSVGELAITGDDLIAIGIPKGPVLGKVLKSLLDSVLHDPGKNQKEILLSEAAELIEKV